MREIEFRRYNSELHYMEPIAIPTDSDMQYTGLKDKNGVEIYHHDLVKHSNRLCEVVWVQSMSCWKLRNRAKGIVADDDWLSKSYTLEVVGNIYENPELLEATK